MSSTVSVGGLEITSNFEDAEAMAEALKPAKEGSAEPKILMDDGKAVEDNERSPVSKAASELGKRGGEAAAKARAEKAQAAVDDAEKRAERKMAKDNDVAEEKAEAKGKAEADDKGDEKPLGKPRDDPRARAIQATAQLAEERRRNAEMAQRLERLEKLADGLTKGAAPDKAEVKAEGETFSGKPRPKSNEFESYDEYVDAVADWKVEERLAKERAETQKQTREQATTQAQRQQQEAFVKKYQAAVDRDPEIESKIDHDGLVSALTAAQRQAAETGRISPASVISDEIANADHPYEILAYFTANPEECAKLTRMGSPREIGRAMALLDHQLGQEAPPEKPSMSKAPPPVPPLRGGAVVPEPDLTEDMDFDEFMRRSARKR